MYRSILTLLVVLTLLGTQQSARATDAVSVDEFLAYQRELRANFEVDEPKPLSAREWRLFDQAQEQIEALLAGRISVDELNAEQRAALMTAQDQVSAILAGEEDDRLICRRERTVGTHFQRTRCVTYAQLRQEREDAREAKNRSPMWQMQGDPQFMGVPQLPPDGGMLRKTAAAGTGAF